VEGLDTDFGEVEGTDTVDTYRGIV